MPPRYDTWREHTIMCARESWLEKKGLAEAREAWIDGISKI